MIRILRNLIEDISAICLYYVVDRATKDSRLIVYIYCVYDILHKSRINRVDSLPTDSTCRLASIWTGKSPKCKSQQTQLHEFLQKKNSIRFSATVFSNKKMKIVRLVSVPFSGRIFYELLYPDTNCTVRYSTVQYGTVQYSALMFSWDLIQNESSAVSHRCENIVLDCTVRSMMIVL